MCLYKITLCYYGENHTFFTHSSSPRKAILNSIFKLEKKMEREKGSLPIYFLNRGNDGRVRVEEVKR